MRFSASTSSRTKSFGASPASITVASAGNGGVANASADGGTITIGDRQANEFRPVGGYGPLFTWMARGLRIVLRPDKRWQLRAAKTTQLLYAVLMHRSAVTPPAELAALVRSDVPRLGKVVKDSGARAE